MNQFDVIIIGSGISSLTSAALLSKKGKRVLVLEQYKKPGGYLHSFSRFGETFDTGAHYVGALYPGQPFHTLLSYLEVFNSKNFVKLDPKGFDIFHFPEGTITMPVGYENVIEEIGSCFPSEKKAIRIFFEMVQSVVKEFPTYHFNEQFGLERPILSLDISLQSVVENITANSKLQSLLYAYCNLHGVMPQDVPFGLHAVMVDSIIIGPMGFPLGGDALVRQFVNRIQVNGGKVMTGQKVIKLVLDQSNIVEVLTESGESFSADWVISSIHPKATFRLVSDYTGLTPAFKTRLNNLKETDGIFGIYARCRKLVGLNPLSNYYFFRSSDPKKIFEYGEPSDPPPSVFTSMSRKSGDSVSGQALSLHSIASKQWFEPWKNSIYGKRDDGYHKIKEKVAAGVFSLVEKYRPDFRSQIEKYTTSTPLTNLHFNGSEEGSGFGIYHSIQNTGTRAIGPRTKISNLLLTGQNYLFPGLLGASISALRTCGHIIGIKPILGELRKLGGRE